MKNLIIKIFLTYLKFFAKLQLSKIDPIIVGIGGANGKSSLTYLANIILKDKYKIKQSGGKNSETGIPLNILNLNVSDYSYGSWLKVAVLSPLRILFDWKKYDIYLVEMGIDSPIPPKNMDYLLSFIKPDISVLTNIQIEHSVYFDNEVDVENDKLRKKELIEEISRQEKLLLTKIDSSGRVIVNLDDEYIESSLPVEAKTLTISRKDKDADFFIKTVSIDENVFKIRFTFLKEDYEIRINQPLPEYYAYIIIFALAISFSNEVGVDESIEILENNFSLPPGRFSVFEGIKNSKIIDSSYNSSLEASIGIIDVVEKMGTGKRRVGIFGNMNELGSVSKLQHELLAKEIARKFDYAILIGDEISKYGAKVFEEQGFSFDAFDSYGEAKKIIPEKIKKGDYVMVKASQNGMFLERVVEDLLADKKNKEKLCRRGSYWDKIRKKAN